jgi:predicted esterase
MKFFNSCQSVKFVPGIFLILFFLGALFWTKYQDPFSRKWFTLETADHNFFKCVAVLPKPIRRCPVVIYAHGWNGNLMNDGNDLRQIAELGLATVSLEYEQTNEAAFVPELKALLRYINKQKWANANTTAWIGFSMGANRMLDFALQHPEQQPQLLVQLSGAGLSEGQTNNHLESLQCPVLLVHGEQDETFPVADTKRLASLLQINEPSVELKIISGLPHSMEPERGVVFRSIGEYCLTHLVGKEAWQNYHSIARWQSEVPPFWLFCLPAAVWGLGWIAWRWYRKPALPEKIKLKRHELALRWLAVFLATWALVETAIHLVTPHFSVGEKTLSIAHQFLVQPKERADFEFLSTRSIWREQKLKTLLDHVELAAYDRELINWQLDDKIYRGFVLSPVITGSSGEQLNWRRPLWEEFYPRIRHESSPKDAAKIVVRHLRERVTIAALPNFSHEVPAIWLQQITDEAGFEIIYVATLRSVGVPARLDSNSQAELFVENKWQPAPQPSIMSW